MKFWTKRAVGVSAIIGGLLVAGTVAANASDLPVVGDALSKLPMGSASSLTAAAAPARAIDPAKAQKGNKSPQKGSPSKTPAGHTNTSTISGIANATHVDASLAGLLVNAPVKVCGNPVNVAGPAMSADCGSSTTGGNKPPKGGNKPPKSTPGSGSSTDISGIANGTTANLNVGKAIVNLPVTVCANPINVAGGPTTGKC